MSKLLDMNVKQALACGMVVIPITPREKRPALSVVSITTFADWQRAQRHYGPNINAGVHLNASNLCVVDLDTAGAFERLSAAIHLPSTMAVRTARGRHLYYRRPAGIGDSGTLWLDSEDKDQPLQHVGEFICGNFPEHYALLPGSVHPSGGVYRWHVHPWHGIATLPSDIYRFMIADSIRYDDN